jgi:hypothetical protein
MCKGQIDQGQVEPTCHTVIKKIYQNAPFISYLLAAASYIPNILEADLGEDIRNVRGKCNTHSVLRGGGASAKFFVCMFLFVVFNC